MLSERNLSVRMTELVAAVIRPLLANLPERCAQFNRRYHHVRGILKEHGEKRGYKVAKGEEGPWSMPKDQGCGGERSWYLACKQAAAVFSSLFFCL